MVLQRMQLSLTTKVNSALQTSIERATLAKNACICTQKSELGFERLWRLATFCCDASIRPGIGGVADIPQASRAHDVTRLTHLRRQRVIFAVMHSGVRLQRYGNVRPPSLRTRRRK